MTFYMPFILQGTCKKCLKKTGCYSDMEADVTIRRTLFQRFGKSRRWHRVSNYFMDDDTKEILGSIEVVNIES